MKKFLVVFAVLVSSLVLFAACAQDPVVEDAADPGVVAQDPAATPAVPAAGGAQHAVIPNVADIRVGFSIKNMHNPYLIAMNATMDQMAAEMGFQLRTLNAGGDMIQQQMDVETLIAGGVDVIVMDAQDPIAAIAKSEYIASHGIPLFLMNATVDPASIFVTLVQSNNQGLGIAVGEWVADQMSDDIVIGLLSGNPGNMVGWARRTGFITGLLESQLMTMNSTNFRIGTQGWGNWSTEVALEAAETMLVAAPDINVIFAENDGMAMGAIIAVENAGRAGEVLIVGVDGMHTALDEIEAGRYGATGVNSPIELVRLTMGIVVDYMTGVNRNIPALINTTPGLVHAGNLEAGRASAF